MPIRPEWRHYYRGPVWRAIRERILARAQNKCERCGVPNHKTVLRQYGWWTLSTIASTVWAQNGRFRKNNFVIFDASRGCEVAVIESISGRQFIKLPWAACSDVTGKPFETMACFPNSGEHRWVYIVLTIAHLNHQPADNRDENLAALCQWCHLKHDVRFHRASARRTLSARVGQQWLDPEIAKV